MKKKPPKRMAGGVKDEYLELRLYTDEKQAFKDAADLQGMALSVWVRSVLRIAAQKQLQEVNRPVAFIEKLSA
jgi:uncharacterized protein (DUF1778 family)